MTVSLPQATESASEGHGIEWLNRPGTVGRTWNPIAGCTKVAPGCLNCYAMKMAMRIACAADAAERNGKALTPKMRAYQSVIKRSQSDSAPLPQWNNHVVLIPEALEEPLRWRKTATVFMSMTDLFHEDVPFEYIDRVLAVMALTPQHTYLILTKRPERAAEYLLTGGKIGEKYNERETHVGLEMLGMVCDHKYQNEKSTLGKGIMLHRDGEPVNWPLPSLWLGCSVSDQKTADESIPHLLRCPAAVRFVSYEPALGPVDFDRIHACDGAWWSVLNNTYTTWGVGGGICRSGIGRIDWVIVGGESGPGARPFDVAWARSTISQCREAGVACFVKQLGSVPANGPFKQYPVRGTFDAPTGPSHRFVDRKGGDWGEWPEDLRVREWPRPEASETIAAPPQKETPHGPHA